MAPEQLQRIILEHCHDKPGAGYMGMNKTTQRVKRYAIWYKMLDSCLVYVRSCSVCNRQKNSKEAKGSSGTISCRIAHRENTYRYPGVVD